MQRCCHPSLMVSGSILGWRYSRWPHTSCPAQRSLTRSSILKRYFGILTGRPDTVVFWYFGHVFWYFVALASRHESGLFLPKQWRHQRWIAWPERWRLGNWFLIYSKLFCSCRLGTKFKWLLWRRRRRRRRSTTTLSSALRLKKYTSRFREADCASAAELQSLEMEFWGELKSFWGQLKSWMKKFGLREYEVCTVHARRNPLQITRLSRLVGAVLKEISYS